MSVFQFKKFAVVNDRSAMKVNTDGVLLGALATVRAGDRSYLDIGTGTGTIGLMLAQRRAEACADEGWKVLAIDIDEESAEEAAANFGSSPWRAHLEALRLPLEELREGTYDLIVSNPPYFDESLKNPLERKSTARHTASLSYREILEFSSRHLAPEGRVAMVLPREVEKDLLRYGRMCGLGLVRLTRVRTVPRKEPKRIIAEFIPGRVEGAEVDELVIQNGGSYTEDYLQLMHDFYLFA